MHLGLDAALITLLGGGGLLVLGCKEEAGSSASPPTITHGESAVSMEIGKARILIPSGWRLEREKPENKVFRSMDGRQQTFISVMSVSPHATFSDFEHLCQLRMEGEKREMADGFVQAEPPFREGAKCGMFFSGGDRESQRVFSGYLSMDSGELITIYVEGIGVDPQDHLESFRSFVSGLTR